MLRDRATASMVGLIPIPSVTRHELHLHEGESGMWVYIDSEVQPRQVEVPVDFYLREATEVDDGPSLGAFLDAWGLPYDSLNRDIVSGEDEVELWARDHGLLSDGAKSLWAGREVAAVELGWLQDDSHLSLEQRLRNGPAEMRHRHELAQRLVNLGEVTLRVFLMRQFIDVALGTQSTNPVDDAGAIDDLNAALSAFGPRVLINDANLQRPTIFNVVAAQIANDIHSGAQFQTCQNETCGRMFTKQRGRADYGAYRTKGVMYCSKSCAKAQAQRELRRRRRKDQEHG